MSTRTALIIGTGLIGGSVAAGLRAGGWKVLGHDADPDAASDAIGLGLVDALVDEVGMVVGSGVDLIVVAAPPKATIEVLSQLHTDTIVMDVAGVKSAVVAAAGHLPRFVATHPMAGREASGPTAANGALFVGASWVVIEGSDPVALDVVLDVIGTLRANPVLMDAESHDRSVALISHLPQLVAGGLLGAAASRPEALDLAAGSFRDLTRVGASQPIPWVEILKTNDEAVLAAIATLRDRLAAIEAAIVSDDDTLLTLLSHARDTRRALGSPVAQVRVALADEPGELAKVGRALASSGVDIRDLQMRHAPHGGGGVLTLSVRPGEDGALCQALEEEGLLLVP